MVDFTPVDDGRLIAEGHGHAEADLCAGLAAALAASRNATKAQVHADLADFAETWYSDEHSFGHDCSAHQDVDKSLWAPGCHAGGFRPVTVATNVPQAGGVRRAERTAATSTTRGG